MILMLDGSATSYATCTVLAICGIELFRLVRLSGERRSVV